MPLRSLAVLLVALLSACAGGKPFEYDLLVKPEQCTAPSAEWLQRDQALDDLATLERILRQGYAGYDELQRQGLDWDDLFGRMHDDLQSGDERIAVRSLRDLLLDHLSPTRDNHLAITLIPPKGPWEWRSTGRHLDAYGSDERFARDDQGFVTAKGERLIACQGQELDTLLRRTVEDDPLRVTYLPVVLSERAQKTLTCTVQAPMSMPREHSVALHRLRIATEHPREPAYELIQGAVPRVRLRDLGYRHKTALDTFVETATELRDAPAMVLDVRGNKGGSDRFVADWFIDLTAGGLRYNQIDRLDGDVTLQGSANNFVCELADPDLSADARSQVEKWLKETEAKLAAGAGPGKPWREWKIYTPEEQGRAPQPFGGALVVLADAGCGSSCESVLLYARQLPGALIVGENSGGVGVFGEVKTYRLPHSGLWLSAGSKWFHNPDPALAVSEGQGYLPDLWLDVKDPLPLVEKLALCLADEDCREGLKLGR